jgi:L-threonylcarbamoyladenylate synthase
MSSEMPSFTTQTRTFDAAAIDEAAALIASGQLVAIPTETVYGLAGDARSGMAVAAIYTAKGRPQFNPLIVHVADLAAAERLVHFNATARALAAAHWPGPLTLVLPLRADSGIASLVSAGLPTLAIRVPAHRAMQALLSASGAPLAAPSANASGRISPTRAGHVYESLAGRIALIIDDGPCVVGLESTIVAVRDEGRLALLRHGPVDLGLDPALSGTIEAPGQLASHYAPRKALRLNVTQAESDEWLIGFGAVTGDASLSPDGDLVEAAARLFDELHRADAASQERIAIAPVPDQGLGRAINDRLARAAA